MTRAEKWTLGSFAVLLLALNLWAAFSRSLWTPDEPRVAGMAREMLEHGGWARPTLNGRAFTEKPPLYFCAAALSIRVFGAREWAPRLASLAFSLGAILFTYLAGARIAGRRAGLVSALVLATSARFMETSQRVMVDPAVGFACAAALLCLLACYDAGPDRRRLWWCAGFWAACAVALLAKSLPALVAPGAAVVGLLLVDRSPKKILRLHPWMAPVALALIVGPWLVFAVKDGWLARHVQLHILDRFTSRGDTGHRNPWFHYLEKFPADFLPWTILLVPAALYAWTARAKMSAERRGAAKVLACWAIGAFVAYSIPSTKRDVYLIPVYPAVALLVGFYIDATLDGLAPGRVDRVFQWLVLAGAGALALAWPVFGLASGRFVAPAILILGGAVAATVTAVSALRAGRMQRYWAATGAALLLGCLGIVIAALTEMNPMKSVRPYAEVVAGAAAPRAGREPRIVGYGARENLLGLVNFYAGRRMKEMSASPESLEEIETLLAGADPVVVVTLSRGRRWDHKARALMTVRHAVWRRVVRIGGNKQGVVVANFVPAGVAPPGRGDSAP